LGRILQAKYAEQDALPTGANQPVLVPVQRQATDVSVGELRVQRARPGGAEQADPLETGLPAHLRFMSERTRAMEDMSPKIRMVEERTIARMRQLLKTDPKAAKLLPILLHARAQKEALNSLKLQPPRPGEIEEPAPPAAEEFNLHLDRYEKLADKLRSYRFRTTRLTRSPWEQKVWLIRENHAVQDVLNLMADRLMSWALKNVTTAQLHSPEVILSQIAGNADIRALFRAAQHLPLDAESFSTAREVPIWQRASRIVWGFIPILGDLTDLSEALSGWDIVEQRPLSGAERAVMLLGALIPFVPGSALRGAREGAEEAAVRLATRSAKAKPEELQHVLRAADAIVPEAKQIEQAVKKLRAGERLTAKETAVLEGAAHRIDRVSASSKTPAAAKHEAKALGTGVHGPHGKGAVLEVPGDTSKKTALTHQDHELEELKKLAPTDADAAHKLVTRYEKMSDLEIFKRFADEADETAAREIRRRFPSNEAALRKILGSDYRPPHSATVVLKRGNKDVSTKTINSGNMTPQERALGFPKNMLATHTEARAVKQADLKPGDFLEIRGQYDPCASCRKAMQEAATKTGAKIRYWWQGGSATFSPPK
jgi:hypothetical protein